MRQPMAKCHYFVLLTTCLVLSYFAFAKDPAAGHPTTRQQTSIWKPSDGWNGLVPGVDTLPKAIAKLGRPNATHPEARSVCFKDNAVTIWATPKSGIIETIKVESFYPDKRLIPRTKEDAYGRYGHLEEGKSTDWGTTFYVRPGFSAEIGFDGIVRSLRFEKPEVREVRKVDDLQDKLMKLHQKWLQDPNHHDPVHEENNFAPKPQPIPGG
jgi:hypothetical protein